ITHERSIIEPFKVGGGVMPGHCKCHKVSIYYAILRQLTNVCVELDFHKNPMKFRMPAEGIEPTRPCDHWILSPARLPVPPRRRIPNLYRFTLEHHYASKSLVDMVL